MATTSIEGGLLAESDKFYRFFKTVYGNSCFQMDMIIRLFVYLVNRLNK
jgi:hypothetical protein